ncbi:putative tyrosine-protein phosphatase, partial [Polyplosphaeria fusca]
PFHPIPLVPNFRDIGGHPTTSPSHHIRTGILYRGSDPSRITPSGISLLHSLHITTDFDLRSAQQIQNTGGYKDMEGITRRWEPVFAEEAYTEEAAKRRYEMYGAEGTEGIVRAFVEILGAGAGMFGVVLRHVLECVAVAESGGEGVQVQATFIHCTTGNNRTGVFVGVLLMLLRVPHDEVCREYALSEVGLAPTRHVNVERLLGKGAFGEYGAEEARRRCERMVGAREESMRALIEEVERRWGGPEGYFLQDVGLSEEEVERLRE